MLPAPQIIHNPNDSLSLPDVLLRRILHRLRHGLPCVPAPPPVDVDRPRQPPRQAEGAGEEEELALGDGGAPPEGGPQLEEAEDVEGVLVVHHHHEGGRGGRKVVRGARQLPPEA